MDRDRTPSWTPGPTQECRPDPVSPRALARRRQRAWPRLELRAALAHVVGMLSRDADLWAGKAGATRRRLYEAIVGLAQDRQSLDVEETLERLGRMVGLASAGTVSLRMGELQHGGWLEHVSTGRKGHEGSVWRVQVPPRFRAPGRGSVPSNRDIKRATSVLRGCLGYRVIQESLTPRLTAPIEPPENTTTPKPAPKEPPAHHVPGAGCSGSVVTTPRRSKATPKQGQPRRAQRSRSRPNPAPSPVWSPTEYVPMRTAVESAVRAAATSPAPGLEGRVKLVTRCLLAGGFQPADVRAVVERVGPCSPMRLKAILVGGHVDRAPRPRPELAPGPHRDLVDALAAALDVDQALGVDAAPRPRVRDREREEREESLSWEAERARVLAALSSGLSGEAGAA